MGVFKAAFVKPVITHQRCLSCSLSVAHTRMHARPPPPSTARRRCAHTGTNRHRLPAAQTHAFSPVTVHTATGTQVYAAACNVDAHIFTVLTRSQISYMRSRGSQPCTQSTQLYAHTTVPHVQNQTHTAAATNTFTYTGPNPQWSCANLHQRRIFRYSHTWMCSHLCSRV